jgi:serine/threonine-protein kinase
MVSTDLLASVRAALARRYVVERQLGRGGMATVFLAQDVRSRDPVAIKVLHPEVAVALGAGRFAREIRILARLSHPNILPLLDSDEAGTHVYYVMPYAAGETLGALIAREGRLPLARAVAITRDIAAALDYAHDRQVIHRDIKPDNILLEPGRAVLCDFGVARAVMESIGEGASSSGLVVGTPAYMSPEQATGSGQVDHRSDIYSLGCVVYQMLAGEPPFSGPTSLAIRARHLQEMPRSLRLLRPELPPAVDAAVQAALAKLPGDRPPTGAELVRRLTLLTG